MAEKARAAALEDAAKESERMVAKSKADKDQVITSASVYSPCVCVSVCR
jgi:hypothetical protein